MMFDEKVDCAEDLELFLRIKKFSKVRFMPSAEVIHNHRNNFKETIKTSFDRGFWLSRVHRNYKKNKDNLISFQSLSVRSSLKFPFWAIYMFLTNSTGYAYFRVVKDLAWRIGVAVEKLGYCSKNNLFKFDA